MPQSDVPANPGRSFRGPREDGQVPQLRDQYPRSSGRVDQTLRAPDRERQERGLSRVPGRSRLAIRAGRISASESGSTLELIIPERTGCASSRAQSSWPARAPAEPSFRLGVCTNACESSERALVGWRSGSPFARRTRGRAHRRRSPCSLQESRTRRSRASVPERAARGNRACRERAFHHRTVRGLGLALSLIHI